MTRSKNIDSKILYVFLAVPLLSSIMSAIHLINMVGLGNPMPMAIALAITFELGSIVSFVALSKSILKRLKKELLIFIFCVLFLLQAFGNVYSSFDYIRRKLLVDSTWLDSFREMFFNAMDVTTTKLTLSILIGLPIPIISLVLLKTAIDYFSFEDLELKTDDTKLSDDVAVKYFQDNIAKSSKIPSTAIEPEVVVEAQMGPSGASLPENHIAPSPVETSTEWESKPINADTEPSPIKPVVTILPEKKN